MLDVDVSARRTLGILCIVLLVAVAGCSGGGGSNGATPTQTDGDESDPTPTDGGPTATPTEGVTDGVTGDTLSSEVIAGHVERLQSAGSFTAEMRGSTVQSSGGSGGSGGSQPVVDWTLKADTTTGELYANGTLSDGSGGQSIPIEMYSPPSSGTTYTRMTFQGQSRISQSQGSTNYTQPGEAGLFEAVELTRNGSATLDGESYQRYSADGSTAVRNQSYFGDSIEQFRMSVLVDPDSNLMRVIDYRYEAQSGDTTTTLSYRIQYTAIGSTTVERPGWMDEA